MAWTVPAGMKYTSPGRMGTRWRQSSRPAVSCFSIRARNRSGVTPGRKPSQMQASGRAASTYHASSLPQGRPKYFLAFSPSGWVWISSRSREWSSLSRKPRLAPHLAAWASPSHSAGAASRQSFRNSSVPATRDRPVVVPGARAEVTREASHSWEHTCAPGPSPRNSLIISPPGIR